MNLFFNTLYVPTFSGLTGWYRLRTVTNYGYGILGFLNDASVSPEQPKGFLKFHYRANITESEYELTQLEFLQSNTPIKFTRARLMTSGSSVYLEVYVSDYDSGGDVPTQIYYTHSDTTDTIELTPSDNSGTLQVEIRFGVGLRSATNNALRAGKEYFIDIPSGATATGTEFVGSGSTYNTGSLHAIRVYPYKLVDGYPVFSATPIQSNTVTVTDIDGAERIDWSWSAVSGADGYRVLRSDTSFGYTYNYQQDFPSGTLTLDDDNSGWVGMSVVTPSRYIRGIAVVNEKVAIGNLSSPTYLLDVYGESNHDRLRVHGSRLHWFANNGVKTVANTVTETTLKATNVVGTTTIPSNLESGNGFRFRLRGVLSTHSTIPSLNLKLKLGSDLIVQTTARNLPASLTNVAWEMDIELRVESPGNLGGAGVAYASGSFRLCEDSATTPVVFVMKSATSISFAASGTFDVTATWGAANAANSLSCQIFNAEYLPFV